MYQLFAGIHIEARDRAEQAVRVGMARPRIDLIYSSRLDDLSAIHDKHAVAHAGNNAEVVGDEDNAGAHRLLDALHQLQDLGLDRHIQGSCRLVCN